MLRASSGDHRAADGGVSEEQAGRLTSGESRLHALTEKQSCRRVATSQSHHDLLPITLLPIT
jgi:hypothetical protein